ncbi:nucleotidyltransferase domain-containing protein [Thermodesulfovibrio sp. N1]
MILYGSKARGDFLEDSDIDPLFVTERFIEALISFYHR